MLLSSTHKPFSVVLVFLYSVLTAIGVVAADCPEPDASALAWLDRMSRSMREANYQGIVTLQRDGDMQVMQVLHTVDAQGASVERLTELTGQGAQVERGPHPLNCMHTGERLLRLELQQENPCAIARQYRFSVADGDRVAGRKAVRINIQPRDMYRFGYIMDLDRETGLLLKAQTFSHGKQVLETMQFAHLTYANDVPPAAKVDVIYEAQHSQPEPQSDSPPSNNAATRAWTVGWLPRGFDATDPPLGIGGRRTYTDGLAVLSVFLEDLDIEIRPGEGVVRQGGTTTYTRGMHLGGQSVLVTVIGEVPVNTARMVADSVNWAE